MKLNLKGFSALFVAIVLALVLAIILIKLKAPMQHVAVEMPSKAADYITADRIPFRTRITAYGNVEPAISLNSMAEVSGKISYLHPNLKSGETIPAGTLVVRIDAEDYAVTLKQTQADLEASRSSLKELKEEKKTTQRSLKLAKENLKFGEAEYQRVKDVYKKRLISKSTLDAEEQKVIQLRQNVEELQGKLNTFDSRHQSVQANIVRTEQAVKSSQTVLGRTEISLPFDARIGKVNIEKNEFVAVGTVLFEAIDLKGVEISAQLPMESMRKLVSHLENTSVVSEQIIFTGGHINNNLGLSASVRLVNNMAEAVWQARVLRISESIDATRQTLGLVVGVDDPYKKIIPGKRPPLIKGMYTAIDIYAPARPAMVIPRKAIHQGRVYIANSDNKLEIRQVDIQLAQGELVVIRNGIEIGERIIITDLIPVIEGMPLQLSVASKDEIDIKQQAQGNIESEKMETK